MKMTSENWKELVDNNKLDYNVYIRLCQCESTKEDIAPLVLCLAKYNPNETSADLVDYMLEWVLDWNSGEWDYTTKELLSWVKSVEEKRILEV